MQIRVKTEKTFGREFLYVRTRYVYDQTEAHRMREPAVSSNGETSTSVDTLVGVGMVISAMAAEMTADQLREAAKTLRGLERQDESNSDFYRNIAVSLEEYAAQ